MKKFSLILFLLCGILFAQSHPNLLLTKTDIKEMKAKWDKYPLFKSAFLEAKQKVDDALARPIDVPVPKDAGGYTHERHKQNYTEMQLAGLMFQVTGEKKYAEFVKQMLLKYADLYPTLGKHPAAASESPGKLFWQSLNEAVWTVYTTQAYDCIYDYLSAVERTTIENNVFRKVADYLGRERIDELDRIHNHGTWACCAVGMTGFVLHDTDLIAKALYGSKKNREGGYIKQLEMLFSPDGYYTEGLYYVRYAMLPFFLFAQVIENNRPAEKIFSLRDNILKKGFYTAIQMTYTNGEFIPINDALKEKNYLSPEVIIALDLTYQRYGADPALLGIAKKQNAVMLSLAGLKVAEAVAKAKSFPDFPYASAEYTDGPNGDEGGVGLLRYGRVSDQSLLMMKYTGHGLSHGHYDKLSMLYYDQGREILQDYGSARFLNVEPKYGGRYLPENKTFCLQTIAHNTITVDEKSHFSGKIDISEQFHSDRQYFEGANTDVQVMSATDTNAYKNVKMQRTMMMINDARFTKPIVVDIFKVKSPAEHQYDLPYYYMGHFIYSNTEYKAFDKNMSPFGAANGYQYLWKEAETKGKSVFQFSWMNGNRFYSITSNADSLTNIYFTRIGAGDPNFNLRHEPAVIFRWKGTEHVFASALEPHGAWDGVREYSAGARGVIEAISVIGSNDEATVVQIKGKENIDWTIMISNTKTDNARKHSVEFQGKKYEWTGNYQLVKN